jgi:hypothetical protein
MKMMEVRYSAKGVRRGSISSATIRTSGYRTCTTVSTVNLAFSTVAVPRSVSVNDETKSRARAATGKSVQAPKHRGRRVKMVK